MHIGSQYSHSSTFICFLFFFCEGLFFYLSFVPTLHSPPPPLPLCCICFILSVASAVLAPLKGGSLFPRATLVPIIVVTLPRPLSRLTKGCTLPFLTEDMEHFTVLLDLQPSYLGFFFSFLSFFLKKKKMNQSIQTSPFIPYKTTNMTPDSFPESIFLFLSSPADTYAPFPWFPLASLFFPPLFVRKSMLLGAIMPLEAAHAVLS